MHIANKILIAKKINDIEDGNKLIKKSIKLKIRKLLNPKNWLN